MFVQQLGRVPSGCKRVPLEKHGKTYMYSHVSACSQANAWLTEASHSGNQPQPATGGCGQVHLGAALGFSQPQAGATRCRRLQCSGQSELAKWWPLSIKNMM